LFFFYFFFFFFASNRDKNLLKLQHGQSTMLIYGLTIFYLPIFIIFLSPVHPFSSSDLIVIIEIVCSFEQALEQNVFRSKMQIKKAHQLIDKIVRIDGDDDDGDKQIEYAEYSKSKNVSQKFLVQDVMPSNNVQYSKARSGIYFFCHYDNGYEAQMDIFNYKLTEWQHSFYSKRFIHRDQDTYCNTSQTLIYPVLVDRLSKIVPTISKLTELNPDWMKLMRKYDQSVPYIRDPVQQQDNRVLRLERKNVQYYANDKRLGFPAYLARVFHKTNSFSGAIPIVQDFTVNR
ncbi:hypothetical protein T09_12630, partial [Trichinella sp. T9]